MINGISEALNQAIKEDSAAHDKKEADNFLANIRRNTARVEIEAIKELTRLQKECEL